MKKSTIFYGALVVALISLACAVYYTLPGVNHILVSGSHPPLDPQPAHMALFYGIAVVCIIAALVTRPKSTDRSQ